MDKPQYAKLSRESGKIGDEFYKCLSAWMSDRSNPDSRMSCLKHGHEYGKALREQIEYLRATQPSHRSESAIQTCQLHLDALESQLRLLECKPDRGN